MRKIKILVALVLVAMMSLSLVGNAFAATGDFTGTAETTVNATGLKAGDTVEVYQLVKWDATTDDWALNVDCGVTLAELKNGITAAEATTIYNTVTTGALTTLTADSNGAVSYDCSGNPGLFYLKAIPAADNKDTVYNPAFVSADYYEGGNTVDFSTTIGSSAVFKKSTVPFDKVVNSTTDNFVDVKIGDVIPYKITTTIPSYGTEFTNPQFKITDTFSAGLTLEGDITVKYGDSTTTESVDNVVTITKGTPSNGFTVEFAAAYLTGLAGATPAIEITYSAKVTTEALNNVTYMDNRAKLTFSNTPTTTKDQDDITRHYTFSIDANLNGGNHGNEKTRELIKIGVDDAGNVITDFTSWVEGKPWTTYTPLQGAKFSLVGNGKTYTAESDANGYISFHGLDAGTYTLTETEAPNGYIKDSAQHTVVITPSYTGDVLNSYTVTVDGNTGSKYTISNMNDTAATVETTVDNTSLTFPFVNTKGTPLPSTGGIGTTLFYVAGIVLVLGAAAIIIARRKAEQE